MEHHLHDYEPIDCDTHDRLLERATLQQPTTLTFQVDEAEPTVVTDVIEDVYTREGAEYMRLRSGIEVRLDKLLRIDG